MIVSINQPAYIPWLGYFERIVNSDVHVVLDHVQFEKNSFINRNKIISVSGESFWLTIPVNTKGKFNSLWINELHVSNTNWRKKHLGSIQSCYAKHPFFKEYSLDVLSIYNLESISLVEILNKHLEVFLDILGIKTQIVYSSELGCKESNSDLILSICKELSATTYFSGAMGRNYLDMNSFVKEKIKIKYQDYSHPVYKQFKRGGFVSNLSIIDCLFNLGPDSLSVIKSG